MFQIFIKNVNSPSVSRVNMLSTSYKSSEKSVMLQIFWSINFYLFF